MFARGANIMNVEAVYNMAYFRAKAQMVICTRRSWNQTKKIVSGYYFYQVTFKRVIRFCLVEMPTFTSDEHNANIISENDL